MFSRILVAVDDVSEAARAIHVAHQLAKRCDARLVVLHCEAPAATQEVTQDRSQVQSLVGALRAQGVDARYVLDYCHDSQVDRRQSRRNRVQQRAGPSRLLVMAPRQRADLGALQRGGLTQRLLAHMRAPLLVWPEHLSAELAETFLCRPGSLVLVPLDGSVRAEEALPLSVAFAEEYERHLVLLRVVPPLLDAAAQSVAPTVAPTEPPARETWRSTWRTTRQYLVGVRRRLAGGTSVPVATRVIPGDPAEQIVRTAQAHLGSLIVMSTRGRSGLAHPPIGSVAQAVMRTASLPVLIIPTQSAPPLNKPTAIALGLPAEAHSSTGAMGDSQSASATH
jgi:nucleotide-binding universal stress UspA family protein